VRKGGGGGESMIQDKEKKEKNARWEKGGTDETTRAWQPATGVGGVKRGNKESKNGCTRTQTKAERGRRGNT